MTRSSDLVKQVYFGASVERFPQVPCFVSEVRQRMVCLDLDHGLVYDFCWDLLASIFGQPHVMYLHWVFCVFLCHRKEVTKQVTIGHPDSPSENHATAATA